ncbi:phage head-tail joining protein [Bradyrhizobium zhanjiangense]|uniref:Uncharacterized protein n=1 Tax=Bradyrhizobium zhanjiangense TaxID=1325107 RepID=A0A4Q0SN47_9BRAD|nr:hypothetical protein [Bradyrhizobium zhanjiangense]RXH41067.1 hypothetical protein XH94_09495 [Bradyrhizobium zhanjiangense]
MATQQQLDDLKAALYAGITTVSYEGKSTTFRSLDEMRGLIAMLENELGICRPTRVVIRSEKGW